MNCSWVAQNTSQRPIAGTRWKSLWPHESFPSIASPKGFGWHLAGHRTLPHLHRAKLHWKGKYHQTVWFNFQNYYPGFQKASHLPLKGSVSHAMIMSIAAVASFKFGLSHTNKCWGEGLRRESPLKRICGVLNVKRSRVSFQLPSGNVKIWMERLHNERMVPFHSSRNSLICTSLVLTCGTSSSNAGVATTAIALSVVAFASGVGSVGAPGRAAAAVTCSNSEIRSLMDVSPSISKKNDDSTPSKIPLSGSTLPTEGRIIPPRMSQRGGGIHTEARSTKPGAFFSFPVPLDSHQPLSDLQQKNITDIFLIAWASATKGRLAIFSCLLSVSDMRILNVYPTWKNHSHQNIFCCPNLIYGILRLNAACTNTSLPHPLKPIPVWTLSSHPTPMGSFHQDPGRRGSRIHPALHQICLAGTGVLRCYCRSKTQELEWERVERPHGERDTQGAVYLLTLMWSPFQFQNLASTQ